MPDDHGELLRRKGAEREAAYLAELRAKGQQVVDVIGPDPWGNPASVRAAAVSAFHAVSGSVHHWNQMLKAIEPVMTNHSEGSAWYSDLNAK